jgi:O-antigen/teichoic acid export membrane protein
MEAEMRVSERIWNVQPRAGRFALLKALLKNRFVRQAFALGTGTAIGQAAVVAATPIWSRLYDPIAFGKFGLVFSFLTATTVAVSLRYELAIPVARNEDEAQDLVFLAFLCSIPVSIFAGVIFLTLTLRGLLGFGAIEPWSAILVTVSFLITGSFSTLRYWHVRGSGFGNISSSLIVQGLSRALAPIILSPLNLGWLGLMSGDIAGRSFGIRKLGTGVFPRLKRRAKHMKISHLFAIARLYRQYPLVFLPSSILDSLSGALQIPVVVAMYGLSVGGEFLLAQQIVSAPSALICNSLGDVFHARLIPLTHSNPSSLPRSVLTNALRLLVVASAVYIPVACLAPFVAAPIFGAQWLRVGEFIAILSPSTIIATMVSPVSRAILMSRIPQIKLLADIVKLIIPIVGLALSAYLPGASVTKSLLWYSGLVAISYLIYLGIVLIAVQPSNQLPSVRL